MKNVEIIKTWVSKCGKIEVAVKGVLILTEEVYCDGHSHTVDCCKIFLDVVLNGKSQGSHITKFTESQKKKVPAGYNHCVGGLALTDAQVEVINSVRKELESHPAYQNKLAEIRKNDAENDARDRLLNSIIGGMYDKNTY